MKTPASGRIWKMRTQFCVRIFSSVHGFPKITGLGLAFYGLETYNSVKM